MVLLHTFYWVLLEKKSDIDIDSKMSSLVRMRVVKIAITEAAFKPACNTQESTLLLKKIEKWNQYINEMYTCNIFNVKLTPSRWWFYSEGNKLYLAKTFHWDWFATKYMYENNPNQRVGSVLNIS